MPDYLVGQYRDVATFVKVYKNGLLYYGWNTKDFSSLSGVSVGEVTALGHLDAATVSALSGSIAILGANSPKPARFRKVINRNPSAAQQGGVSTFVGADNYGDAYTAGWRISKSASGVSISNNGRTVTVGARTSGGGIYLFPMNAVRAAEVAGELGLVLPEQLSGQERMKSFTGSSYPRPPQVKKKGTLGGKSTFCSADSLSSAVIAGWQPSKAEVEFRLGTDPAPDPAP